ncbi:esterase-like activity of phytase family protein [Ciceribacter sp. L1K23]|nr:esterase-like activity of phytase family protein [Ciceribacter sp. L1K23]
MTHACLLSRIAPLPCFARRLQLFASAFLLSSASVAQALPVQVHATPITVFRSGVPDNRLGALEFVGGMELSSAEPLFGAWSSIRFVEGNSYIGVLDTGHWFTGTVVRDSDGRISGIENAEISPMTDAAGRSNPGKANMDAESLALRKAQVLVGFEQRHRIDVYPADKPVSSRPLRSLQLPFSIRELRGNGGLETLAVAPKGSPLAGALVAVAERSVDDDGHLFAGIVDGPMKGVFKVVRRDEFDVTDGAFLPNGDLLLLERRFSLATGVGMRIRRIDGRTIRPGAVVNGEILLEADLRDEIDNMEGIDVVKDADGSIRIILVSDDNHSILQRNLMLEFRLLE